MSLQQRLDACSSLVSSGVPDLPRGTLVAMIVTRRCPRAASRTSEELSGPKAVRDSRPQG